MKISASKKQLARIISENGGWRDGAELSWFQGAEGGKECHEVWFGACGAKPEFKSGIGFCSYRSKVVARFSAAKFANWHQTIISSNEYFHLYPAPDADDMPSEINNLTQVGDTDVVELKPTIEHLAAEYRNRKDYAERKQKEADEAKAEAEAKLAELVAAGKAVGLVLSVGAPDPEPDHPFRVGDTVRLIKRRGGSAKLGEVGTVVRVDSATDLVVDFPSQRGYLVDDTDVKLVSKEADNA